MGESGLLWDPARAAPIHAALCAFMAGTAFTALTLVLLPFGRSERRMKNMRIATTNVVRLLVLAFITLAVGSVEWGALAGQQSVPDAVRNVVECRSLKGCFSANEFLMVGSACCVVLTAMGAILLLAAIGDLVAFTSRDAFGTIDRAFGVLVALAVFELFSFAFQAFTSMTVGTTELDANRLVSWLTVNGGEWLALAAALIAGVLCWLPPGRRWGERRAGYRDGLVTRAPEKAPHPGRGYSVGYQEGRVEAARRKALRADQKSKEGQLRGLRRPLYRTLWAARRVHVFTTQKLITATGIMAVVAFGFGPLNVIGAPNLSDEPGILDWLTFGLMILAILGACTVSVLLSWFLGIRGRRPSTA